MQARRLCSPSYHPMHAGEAPVFRAGSSSSSSQEAPRYLILDWQPEAFRDDQVAAALRGAAYCSRDLLEADGASRSGVACGRGGAAKISLHTCIDLFSQQEKLDEENAWYCPKCKELRQGTKQMQFWSAPPVLVVHLKRFSASGTWRRKLDTPVDPLPPP